MATKAAPRKAPKHVQTLTKRNRLEGIFNQMVMDFQTHKPVHMDIGDFIAPNMHEFTATNTNQGTRRDGQILNSTPEDALDIGVSGLFNGLCDPTEKWMAVEADDPDLNDVHAVQVFTEELGARFLSDCGKSNFYTVAPEDFASILAFGTCASLQLEFFGDSPMWFGAMPPGSYYIGVDQWWRVNQVGREWQMTARAMVAEFGYENVSWKVQQAVDNNTGEQQFQVKHLIYPNPEFREGSFDPKRKRYASCYYEIAGDHENKMLLEEGFSSFPARVARWKTRGNGAWGYGPGHRVLGDCKSLQTYEYDIAWATEMQVNPPTITPSGVNMQAGALLPGARTQATDPAGAQGVRAIFEVDFNVQNARINTAAIEERIREGFYNNIFLMLANDDGGKMTAREVMERAREKRLALTPILRLTHEYLTPTFARWYEIAGKRGLLPAPPPELHGKKLKIVYKGVLAQAAEMEDANASRDSLGFAVEMAKQLQDPTLMDVYNVETVLRNVHKKMGAPAEETRSDEEVAEIRASRAQAQAKQEAIMQAQEVAKTAEVLSKTTTDGKNALTDIIAASEEQ